MLCFLFLEYIGDDKEELTQLVNEFVSLHKKRLGLRTKNHNFHVKNWELYLKNYTGKDKDHF